jgi:dihydroorotase-like cyclic amidohydrolase
MTVLGVRAPLAWLGPDRLVDDALIVLDGGVVAFAGPERELGVTVEGASGRETLSGLPAPPEPDQEIHVDGFVIPGVVDRHVHIGL